MKTIELIIGPKGDVQLETRGFAGADCRAVARQLVGSLGQTMSEQLTAEFYRNAQAYTHQVNAMSLPPFLGVPNP